MRDDLSLTLGDPSASVPPGQPVVAFTDVELSFAGVKAIRGVSFEVGPRELFAIIGPNGAGKTSIFNVLSGVYQPQKGSVRFLGEEILGEHPYHIARRGMARTFQNIELFENLTVIDNLMLGRHVHVSYGSVAALLWWGKARREELRHRKVVEEIIDFLEIQQWRKYPVGLLPYGIQKRVELGRALALEPKLLLLDEPVAGMNLEETEDMARFILDVRDELGIPMVLVEHDMGLVMDLADRVMVVDFGAAIATGPPREVQRDPNVIRAYLGEDHSVASRNAQREVEEEAAAIEEATGEASGDGQRVPVSDSDEAGAEQDVTEAYGAKDSDTMPTGGDR